MLIRNDMECSGEQKQSSSVLASGSVRDLNHKLHKRFKRSNRQPEVVCTLGRRTHQTGDITSCRNREHSKVPIKKKVLPPTLGRLRRDWGSSVRMGSREFERTLNTPRIALKVLPKKKDFYPLADWFMDARRANDGSKCCGFLAQDSWLANLSQSVWQSASVWFQWLDTRAGVLTEFFCEPPPTNSIALDDSWEGWFSMARRPVGCSVLPSCLDLKVYPKICPKVWSPKCTLISCGARVIVKAIRRLAVKEKRPQITPGQRWKRRKRLFPFACSANSLSVRGRTGQTC